MTRIPPLIRAKLGSMMKLKCKLCGDILANKPEDDMTICSCGKVRLDNIGHGFYRIIAPQEGYETIDNDIETKEKRPRHKDIEKHKRESMPGRTPFAKLREAMPPEAQARAQEKADRLHAALEQLENAGLEFPGNGVRIDSDDP